MSVPSPGSTAATPGAAVQGDSFSFVRTCPIMRIFDEAKAREFYLDFLGMRLDWEGRFSADAPLYAQVSRGGLTLHLSEHHGDATPGSTVFVSTENVRAYHAELAAKTYRFYNPSVEVMPWGLEMSVTDPFGNRIRFTEQRSSQ
jgi:catechol 2,3-dioxygenase-like lactoylglutathione lyase family enzyme